MDGVVFWARLERSFAALEPEAVGANSAVAVESEADKARSKRRWTWRIRMLDAVSGCFWVYTVVKLFVTDVDRVAAERLAPWSVRFLGYRFFLWVGLTVAIVGFLKKRYWLYLAYILMFPLVVCFYKIPQYVYKRKSWSLLLAVMSLIASFILGFRYFVVSKGLMLIAALLCLVVRNDVVVAIAIAYLAASLLLTYYRAVRSLFETPTFLRGQEKAIKFLASRDGMLGSFAKVDVDFKREDVELFTKSQLEQFKGSLQVGIAANRFLYLWAYQLDNYRKKSVGLALGLASFVLLSLYSAAVFALINIGLYHIDSSEFTVASSPSFMRMLLYSLSSLALNAGAGIEAFGDWASAVRVFAGVSGIFILAGVVLNLIMSKRGEAESASLEELVRALKDRAAAHEAMLRDAYYVGVDEALVRLSRMGSDMTFILGLLVGSVPDEFFEP